MVASAEEAHRVSIRTVVPVVDFPGFARQTGVRMGCAADRIVSRPPLKSLASPLPPSFRLHVAYTAWGMVQGSTPLCSVTCPFRCANRPWLAGTSYCPP